MRYSIALALSLSLAACGSDGGTVADFDDAALVADFADQVAVPTYALLDQRAAALEAAAVALEAAPSATTLEAAKAAWVATRSPWEQNEAFLFGPVSSFGYDPAMDSWPVNTNDLEAVLAAPDELTAAYIHNLPDSQKGFHTIEYLLWGEGQAREAEDLTARELTYLTGLSRELHATTTALAASWTTSVDGRTPYRDVFATAGETGNTAYPSRTAAVQELLGGMAAICDEVANGKIADPYDAHDPNLVESQYSYNSLVDFQDNLRSVRNAYTGAVADAGTSGRGLAAWVAERDPALDTRVRAEIQTAIDALAAIPAPFRDAIKDPTAYAKIEAAQAAIRTLQQTIEGDLTATVLP
ncbi:MAG: peptidase M75 [Deltaproteobacteria bacterium]|nr:peptidase M75 [Deltaproteobacteria bacterium]